MIIRNDKVSIHTATDEQEKSHGAYTSARFSEDGGIKQFGAYLETLAPGSRSSDRHWHEKEDEFLYVVSGELTIVENDGEHLLKPGDAACWPAGLPNAHHALNRSASPCSYLIVGTRPSHDVCHYPDSKRRLHTEGNVWRLEELGGKVIKSGNV